MATQSKSKKTERGINRHDAAQETRLPTPDSWGRIDLPLPDAPLSSAGDPVMTVDDVSRRFNVSHKTVDRWRKRGLVSQRVKIGNRMRVGFFQSSVEQFVAQHSAQVERGSRFSQLTDQHRTEIIERAGRLAQAGLRRPEVIRQLAKEFGRSAETIRLTLKNHAQAHPTEAIFGSASSGMTEQHKQQIYAAYRRGMPVTQLAADYHRSQATITRVIRALHIDELTTRPIEFIDSPDFRTPNAEATILASAPEAVKPKQAMRRPTGLPPYLASLYDFPLLTKEQEAYYFRKMNYLKFQASQLRDQLSEKRATLRDIERIEDLLRQVDEIRNLLVRRNLRLVVSIAKKYQTPSSNFFEMVSDGNVSLMRAIDRFDYGRGFKLSTYATWAIMRNFSRSIPSEYSQLDRFRTGNSEMFQTSIDDGTNQFEQELTNRGQRRVLTNILNQLGDRDRQIIAYRFGLDSGTEPLTLQEVGQRLGVSKERIRQLETRALGKLREIVDKEKPDIPGL